MIEVTLVRRGAENGRHGRDIKAKQAASNDGDGCNHVDVPHGHDGRPPGLVLEIISNLRELWGRRMGRKERRGEKFQTARDEGHVGRGCP